MTILDAALDYRRRGFSVLPLKASKKPAVTEWKRLQDEAASEHDIRAWYEADTNLGVGIVMGAVSGGLGSRDFDRMDSYRRWSMDFPDLATTLPTVETDRGRHVYFICSQDCEQASRVRLEKPDSRGAIDLGDGELRIGRCYNAAPMTVRKSGKPYRWLVSLDGLRRLDPFDSGLIGLYREGREAQKMLKGERGEPLDQNDDFKSELLEPDSRLRNVPAEVSYNCGRNEPLRLPDAPPNPHKHLPFSLDSLPLSVKQRIEAAIERTVPPCWGTRNKLIFRLARALRGIDELARSSAHDLKPIVQEWHRRAKPYMRAKAWERTWFPFVSGWDNVEHPEGKEPIRMLFQKVATLPPPAEANEYDEPELKALVSLCRELQRTQGSQPFFLANRIAGELLGVSHSLAAQWLRGLCADRVLDLVNKGSSKTRRASRYRYLGAL